mmetsp:Transcript_55463/g.81031  ORF Transcript_55463/g.81031 Transcript_55463/m.81031 type:complete len:136 (+) Transcript_55463:22-429(+)
MGRFAVGIGVLVAILSSVIAFFFMNESSDGALKSAQHLGSFLLCLLYYGFQSSSAVLVLIILFDRWGKRRLTKKILDKRESEKKLLLQRLEESKSPANLFGKLKALKNRGHFSRGKKNRREDSAKNECCRTASCG